MESVVRAIVAAGEETEIALIDLTEVTEIDPAAARTLGALGVWLGEGGRVLGVVAPPDGELELELPEGSAETFPDLDAATEWAEERLLAAHGGEAAVPERVALAQHRLARGLDAAALARLEDALEPLPFGPGETIFAAGDPAGEIYLLLAGEVRVEVEVDGGRGRRLATLTPGLAFGELALADVPVRPVTVSGESEGECLVLSVEAFDRLGATDPALQVALVRNLLISFADTIGRLTREARSLFGA
jgi:glutaminase